MHHFRITFFFLVFSLFAKAQDSITFCQTLHNSHQLIQYYHIKPKPINDTLSQWVFNRFLNNLNPEYMYFTNGEVNKLAQHKNQLDDYIISAECSFITEFQNSYVNALERLLRIVRAIQPESLDFSGKDSITFNHPGNAYYEESEEDLTLIWLKKIRFLIIQHYLDSESKTPFENEKNIISHQVIQEELCQLEEKLELAQKSSSIVENQFLYAFTNYFDPHTSYFNNADKSSFEESVYDDYETTGLYFERTNGKVYVSYIQPGSSAWKLNSFEAGDEILRLASEQEVLELGCVSDETFANFIYNPSHKQITFSVKKINTSEVRHISVVKERTQVIENVIDSYLLKGNPTIGYIKLNSFYTSDEFGKGCANDFKDALMALEPQNLEALILDLRNNGGGSMDEAAKLVSLLINKGPISILNHKNNDKKVIRDFNSGRIFDNPLIVLVNEETASASEYTAAALQDHSAAIIIGTPTFGKGTSQQLFYIGKDEGSMGYVKITSEKMYRINGTTFQQQGVVPDISIVSLFSNLKNAERNYNNSIPPDTIIKNTYFKSPAPLNLTAVSKKSEARQKSQSEFQIIRQINDSLVRLSTQKQVYPLSMVGMLKRKTAYDKIWELSDQTTSPTKGFTIEYSKEMEKKLKHNEELSKQYTLKVKELNEDFQLIETYRIITDFLEEKK